jgi:titin
VFISEASGNTVGGTESAAANTISGNDKNGIIIIGATAKGNRILRNSIFENGQLGIELNNDGVTLNDHKDPDPGPNKLQNFPVLSSASTTTIKGTLNSRPRKTFTIQYFSNSTVDPTGNGEGKTFLGQKNVRTNTKGKASLTFTPPAALSAGQFVTTTATDSAGNTSEFSQARTVQ